MRWFLIVTENQKKKIFRKVYGSLWENDQRKESQIMKDKKTERKQHIYKQNVSHTIFLIFFLSSYYMNKHYIANKNWHLKFYKSSQVLVHEGGKNGVGNWLTDWGADLLWRWGATPQGKALHLPIHHPSSPHLWPWALASNKIKWVSSAGCRTID